MSNVERVFDYWKVTKNWLGRLSCAPAMPHVISSTGCNSWRMRVWGNWIGWVGRCWRNRRYLCVSKTYVPNSGYSSVEIHHQFNCNLSVWDYNIM